MAYRDGRQIRVWNWGILNLLKSLCMEVQVQVMDFTDSDTVQTFILPKQHIVHWLPVFMPSPWDLPGDLSNIKKSLGLKLSIPQNSKRFTGSESKRGGQRHIQPGRQQRFTQRPQKQNWGLSLVWPKIGRRQKLAGSEMKEGMPLPHTTGWQ